MMITNLRGGDALHRGPLISRMCVTRVVTHLYLLVGRFGASREYEL